MRTGKIDAMDGLSATQAQQMAVTNPVIIQIPVPNAQALSIDPRNDKAPFTDVRVREALQMAIDLPTIAKTYYNGTASPYPSALTSVYETGWGLPYSQWPQTLKDQYTYNPTQAMQLLAAAGYPKGFSTDVVADNASDLVLLQIIQSYFAAVNVTMTINPMDTASWTAFVRGHNNDALGFSSAGGLGLSYDPIRQLQRFLPTNGSNYPDVNDPGFNAFYPQAMAATSQDQIKQILTNANTYVAEQHFSISLLQPMTYSLCQPWFKGFAGQNFSITGFQGPPLIGFYVARFWIVPN
jgi:ABC-type transport system substrate-binding protein